MGWTDPFIGLDYQSGGRGPAFDCLGFFLALQLKVFGRSLPDPVCGMELARANPGAQALWSLHRRVDEAAPGDCALFRVGSQGLHVATMVDATRMLHIEGPEGSCLAHVTASRYASRFEGFWRYAI